MARLTNRALADARQHAVDALRGTPRLSHRAPVLARLEGEERGCGMWRYGLRIRLRFECCCGFRLHPQSLSISTAYVCRHCGAVFRVEGEPPPGLTKCWRFYAAMVQIVGQPEPDHLLVEAARVEAVLLS